VRTSTRPALRARADTGGIADARRGPAVGDGAARLAGAKDVGDGVARVAVVAGAFAGRSDAAEQPPASSASAIRAVGDRTRPSLRIARYLAFPLRSVDFPAEHQRFAG